jgi:hypothetical protein
MIDDDFDKLLKTKDSCSSHLTESPENESMWVAVQIIPCVNRNNTLDYCGAIKRDSLWIV